MDNPTRVAGGGFPLVAQASAVQFGPDDRLAFPRVESRMLLMCVSGCGHVDVNDVEFDLTPAVIVLLPWGHTIRYRPDAHDPFFVYGMHLVPWHAERAAVELSIPHEPGHALAGVRWRRDAPLAEDTEVLVTDQRRRPRLATLMHYAAQLWDPPGPDVGSAKALGALAMRELTTAPHAAVHDDPRVPPELRRLLLWIERNLADQITVSALAGVVGISTTSVNRLFRRHLATSPMSWVIDRRIERAARLLSTTDLTVAQVARRSGLHDPYYFSRLFSVRAGMAPREWRRHRSAP
jgi:AraC family transcriptional regulator, arabinose operon regulatory protein